ncbi:Fe-S cluster domain-containing protein [Prosthecochloris sp. N3]|uniref:Ion-translocating oxidoreductase complex subunit B n=1 Tax=Prosthecochloris ethylica TaxID=2743976 RepID=A0ABR9XS68_9CHLB|nr:Fe-S cluster domain-containing protein [Prosthecochloris ethylica]MBF0585355.1 Fe-S cluster domain-containing protein [Prosthecochloris ethylica]MBF0636891.1 Fe-S cluster domain-containing protein [Prosthecochloris ethylica]MEC9487069.1 Fe-S cluster domain-containing protein [Prosthecochloris sp.]NUK46584.1 Fe-S cluster domain-containing protein [Prosthecochloris ethylica]
MISEAFIPAVSSLGAVALALGVIIHFVSKKFHVEEDPMVTIINDILPGVNCGACGYPSCNQFAEVLVETKDSSMSCPVGGSDLAAKLGDTLGIEMAEPKPQIAVLMCQGDNDIARETAEYMGIQDCWAATQAFVGPKQCRYSCVGLGSCIAYCDFDAMRLENGLVVIDKDKCTGCEACIAACPTGVLVMQEKKAERYFIACNSHDKGAATKKACDAGCIACQKCVKVCEDDAIVIDNFLAKIDQEKCTACGKCIEVCPTKVNCIRLEHDLNAVKQKKAS